MGGGTTSLKDFYRDKVINGGLTEVTYTIYNNRLNISEGKLVVDTSNNTVYVYFDFTTTATGGGSSTWATLLTFSSELSNYLPKFASNSRNNAVGITTDSSSDYNINFFIGYGSSNFPRTFGGAYGKAFAIGEHYIVYGSWTY